MTDIRLVLTTLARCFRWIALGFLGGIVAVTVGGDVLLSRSASVPYSLWMTIAANGTKYWLSVVGVILVSMYLRPFVAAGLTRRAFVRGAAVFLLVAGLGLSLLVVAGHAVEQALVHPGATYPALTAGNVAAEFGHVLVTLLAYLATGAAITAGFYRWRPPTGLLLMVPALVPVLLAEGLLGLGPYGAPITRLLPFGLALAVTLVAAALVAAMGERELRHAPIRRAAG